MATGYIVERGGFPSATKLIASLVDDMVANGFDLIYPQSFTSSSATAPYKILLEAGSDVDPLASTQPWRVMFDVQQAQVAFCYVGTPATLADDGSLPMLYEVSLQKGPTVMSQDRQVMLPTDVIGNINFKMGTNVQNLTTSPGNGNPTDNVQQKVTATGVWSPYKVASNLGNSQWALDTVKDDPKFGIINRAVRIGSGSGAAFPLRYRLVISPRGVWIGIWEDADSDAFSYNFNWFLIQRPVDRETGTVVTTGKAPVWCVAYNGANQDFPDQTYFFQTVVREADVLKPAGVAHSLYNIIDDNNDPEATTENVVQGTDPVTNLLRPNYARRRAEINQEDSDAIINSENQVSLSEDQKYIVTFPARLNTNRFSYSYELDMIGFTSADVVSNGTIVPLTVYGEPTNREYLALKSSGSSNTGVRIVVLNLGGGITP